MITLAVLSFVVAGTLLPFVLVPSWLYGWLNRDADGSDFESRQEGARFATLSRELCAVPLLLALAVGIYAAKQAPAAVERHLAQERQEAERAAKIKEFGVGRDFTKALRGERQPTTVK
jgi:hypothetical protein